MSGPLRFTPDVTAAAWSPVFGGWASACTGLVIKSRTTSRNQNRLIASVARIGEVYVRRHGTHLSCVVLVHTRS